jgi:molybdopterin molybdotransferase
LAAALGLTQVEVRRRIRVAVFSTGNELAAPGGPREPAQIFDSNRLMLTAMLRRLGCVVSDLGNLRDDPDRPADALKDAAERHDLVLTSGGVSTGEEDHVRVAVARVGTIVFWRLAIRPGRPVAMGVICGTPFIGLPGSPVASFVTFAHIVRPTVMALSGAAEQRPMLMPVRAAFIYSKRTSRREYVRVAVRPSADGFLEAVKFPRDGTGFLTSLVEADGLVELGESIEKVDPGQIVNFLPYESLG